MSIVKGDLWKSAPTFISVTFSSYFSPNTSEQTDTVSFMWLLNDSMLILFWRNSRLVIMTDSVILFLSTDKCNKKRLQKCSL